MAQDSSSGLTVQKITNVVTNRKKAGLIISNCASIPQWLPNEQLPDNIASKIGQDNHIFDANSQTLIPPLQSTFTDGYAMYTTYKQVENCEVDFIANVNGSDLLDAIDSLFAKSTEGYNDFFIHYSGFSEHASGNWMAYDASKAGFHVIRFEKLLKRWNQRPRCNAKYLDGSGAITAVEAHRRDQYCLIVSDANFSGVWAARGKQKNVVNSNFIVQSAVAREEEATELNIGQIVNGWITQIICSKFTHCWIEMGDNFIKSEEKLASVMEMKGSFVVLKKKTIWDDNIDYHTDLDHPMCSLEGRYGENVIVVLPCYGHNEEAEALLQLQGTDVPDADDTKQAEDTANVASRASGNGVAALLDPSQAFPAAPAAASVASDTDSTDTHGLDGFASSRSVVVAESKTEETPPKRILFASGDLQNAIKGLGHRSDISEDITSEYGDDADTDNEKRDSKLGQKTVTLKPGDDGTLPRPTPRRRSHLPTPSVRRLNLLDNVKSGKNKLKHVKMKSRSHKSTASKFVFAKVLADIRQIIMPDSDKEEEEEDDKTKNEWLA